LENRVFFGKTEHGREGRFSIPRKHRKTPLCILGKKSPLFEKRRDNGHFPTRNGKRLATASIRIGKRLRIETKNSERGIFDF
jgi:hypothetical protein